MLAEKEVREGLIPFASQIEERVREQLGLFIWDAEKNIVVNPYVNSPYYCFILYVGDKQNGMSNEKSFSEFPPDEQTIEVAVDLLTNSFNTKRSQANREGILEKCYSDHQLIMMALARLLYRTDDMYGQDAALAYILYDRI